MAQNRQRVVKEMSPLEEWAFKTAWETAFNFYMASDHHGPNLSIRAGKLFYEFISEFLEEYNKLSESELPF